MNTCPEQKTKKVWKASSGIYRVLCRTTGDSYIGKSKQVAARWGNHIFDLMNGRHCNKRLQEVFDAEGIETFVFEVLALCRLEELERLEMNWIKHLRPSCNVAGNEGFSARKPRIAVHDDDRASAVSDAISDATCLGEMEQPENENAERWHKAHACGVINALQASILERIEKGDPANGIHLKMGITRPKILRSLSGAAQAFLRHDTLQRLRESVGAGEELMWFFSASSRIKKYRKKLSQSLRLETAPK